MSVFRCSLSFIHRLGNGSCWDMAGIPRALRAPLSRGSLGPPNALDYSLLYSNANSFNSIQWEDLPFLPCKMFHLSNRPLLSIMNQNHRGLNHWKGFAAAVGMLKSFLADGGLKPEVNVEAKRFENTGANAGDDAPMWRPPSNTAL